MNKHAALGLITALFLFGCGKEKKAVTPEGQRPAPAAPAGPKLGGFPYSEVGAGNKLEHKGTSVAGNGRVIFHQPVAVVEATYDLAFSLRNDKSSLVVVVRANRDLQKGVSVSFTRDKEVVQVKLDNVAVDKKVAEVLAKQLKASEPLAVQLKVKKHGDHLDVDLLDRDGKDIGELGHSKTAGADNFYGLVLSDAVVTKAKTK